MKSLKESLFDDDLAKRGFSVGDLYNEDVISTSIQFENWLDDNFDINKFVKNHKISKKEPSCVIYGRTISDIEEYILSYIKSINIKKTIDYQGDIELDAEEIGKEVGKELLKYIPPKQKKFFSIYSYNIPAGFVINIVIYKGNYRLPHISVHELERELTIQFKRK